MKSRKIFICLILILPIILFSSGCTQPAPVQDPTRQTPASTREEMVSFVKEAVAYAKTHGKDAALAEFSNRNGSFFRADLYIYAYDFNGTTIAHPVNPEKIGVNRLFEPDAMGHSFIRELRDEARNGSGFVEYYYINPVHNKAVEKKLGYVEKAGDDWWLGSGIYFGQIDPAVASSAKAPATALEIKEFVDKAAVYAKKSGKTAAVATFNNASGPFVVGNVYIYALDYDGVALALPFQPGLIGTNFLPIKDASGKTYTDTEIQLAKSGGGYLLYRYADPAQNFTVKPKISYVRPVDDTYWIGAGIYTSEDRLLDPQLREFVTEAKTYAMKNGRQKALENFSNVTGPFIRGDLYVFAYDYNGTVLSWPYRPDQVGLNRFNATDTVGTPHIRAMIDTARNGGGIVDYYSVNPATNTTQLKISYVTDVDGTWLLGSGRYLEPGPVVLSP
ncbi:cache domain-containing protein [uncultured Methanoregula sp.]|uniref:cache domain-containing protein n=1 Tax=uncultured Methanoregula sp. TaxID=1005933 RepID=UPI002AAAF9D9|nr:cache domain-containing protein [uncultured Methanoregula sp.]